MMNCKACGKIWDITIAYSRRTEERHENLNQYNQWADIWTWNLLNTKQFSYCLTEEQTFIKSMRTLDILLPKKRISWYLKCMIYCENDRRLNFHKMAEKIREFHMVHLKPFLLKNLKVCKDVQLLKKEKKQNGLSVIYELFQCAETMKTSQSHQDRCWKRGLYLWPQN